MGLFGDRLLLRLNTASLPTGEPKLNIEKMEAKFQHLLPFSCVSILGSQLTVLNAQHPKALCKRVIGFVESPTRQFETTSLVAGFNLEMYEGRNGVIYNQFNPVRSRTQSYVNDDFLQTDIERILMNYTVAVFAQSEEGERPLLRVFLLLMVRYYQREIIPIIQQINVFDLEQRKKLANTQVILASMIYKKWNHPHLASSESDAFQDTLAATKGFDGYL